MVSFVNESDITRPGCASVIERNCVIVVADAVFDGELVPTEFIADTLYVYVVFGTSPVSENVVAAEPVFGTIVLQLEPPVVDCSILYPIIDEPPLSAGAVQLRLICDDDELMAVSPVGGCGIMLKVVDEETLEDTLVPTALMVDTLYVYVVLCTSPVSENVVAAEPVFGTTVLHVVPSFTDLSIWYPVIGEPPLSAGAVQDKLICNDEVAVAVNPVGN